MDPHEIDRMADDGCPHEPAGDVPMVEQTPVELASPSDYTECVRLFLACPRLVADYPDQRRKTSSSSIDLLARERSIPPFIGNGVSSST